MKFTTPGGKRAEIVFAVSSRSGSKGQDYFFRGVDGLAVQPRWELLPLPNEPFRRGN